MGCNSSQLSIHEPQGGENKRKIGRNPNQLTEIQQNIEKHLKKQFAQSGNSTLSPNSIISSNRSSRITDQKIDISKSTIIFEIDNPSQTIHRRSLQ